MTPIKPEETQTKLSLREELRLIAHNAALDAVAMGHGQKRALDWQAILLAVLAILGAFAWSFRQEGRINSLESRAIKGEEADHSLGQGIITAQEPIIKRLDRMEDKVDRLLSGEGRKSR